MKIKGYFICSPKQYKNPKTKKWERKRKPCKHRIPIYNLEVAEVRPYPRCKCGCPMNLYDIELNRDINKIFKGDMLL